MTRMREIDTGKDVYVYGFVFIPGSGVNALTYEDNGTGEKHMKLYIARTLEPVE